jgi:hypothetical protein
MFGHPPVVCTVRGRLWLVSVGVVFGYEATSIVAATIRLIMRWWLNRDREIEMIGAVSVGVGRHTATHCQTVTLADGSPYALADEVIQAADHTVFIAVMATAPPRRYEATFTITHLGHQKFSL